MTQFPWVVATWNMYKFILSKWFGKQLCVILCWPRLFQLSSVQIHANTRADWESELYAVRISRCSYSSNAFPIQFWKKICFLGLISMLWRLAHFCCCRYHQGKKLLQSLWICLICGHVGCGRYVGGHAFTWVTKFKKKINKVINRKQVYQDDIWHSDAQTEENWWPVANFHFQPFPRNAAHVCNAVRKQQRLGLRRWVCGAPLLLQLSQQPFCAVQVTQSLMIWFQFILFVVNCLCCWSFRRQLRAQTYSEQRRRQISGGGWTREHHGRGQNFTWVRGLFLALLQTPTLSLCYTPFRHSVLLCVIVVLCSRHFQPNPKLIQLVHFQTIHMLFAFATLIDWLSNFRWMELLQQSSLRSQKCCFHFSTRTFSRVSWSNNDGISRIKLWNWSKTP